VDYVSTKPVNATTVMAFGIYTMNHGSKAKRLYTIIPKSIRLVDKWHKKYSEAIGICMNIKHKKYLA
jgi:hypothetical protein